MVKMGISTVPPAFPPDGISLVQLVPWWRLWPREPRKNRLENYGAAVLPAVASGLVTLEAHASLGQAIFTAMLPMHALSTAVAQWTEWAIGSIFDKAYPGPAPLLGVLEHLLQNQSEMTRAEAWSRILESAFDKEGQFRYGPEDHAIALLETVGRSGLRSLAPLVVSVLRNQELEMVLAAIACLARLGVPDTELPAECLLNRIRPEMMEHTRGALGFVETGDVDLLAGPLRLPGWGERLQSLRLMEAVLARGCPEIVSKKGWTESLVDLLLAQLQQDEDRDIARCLAVTLGLALRGSGEPQLARVFEVAVKLTDKTRFESVLNALVIAELPASAASRVEELRKQAVGMDLQTLRALNRVLMSLGEPSGIASDWLGSSVVAFMQLGVLRLPEPVRDWFDSPAACPEAAVAAWLAERPDSGLALTFCAAYLAARPSFLKVVERIWIQAADGRKSATLKTVGALLAGAAEDCNVSPVELRCCLGHDIGGPLEESPEMLGQLLGLLMTQSNEIFQSAEELLRLTSAAGRMVASFCGRSLKRDVGLFGDNCQCWSRFGLNTPPPNHDGMLPQSLQPLFAANSRSCCQAARLLEALSLPDKRSKSWVRGCLEWENPESVKTTFEGVDSATLVSSFLQTSASQHPEGRRLAGLLAAGIGPRLMETPHRDRVVQRVIFLAAHDADAKVRPAGRKAAEALGIADRVPNTPAPPPTPEDKKQGSEPEDRGQEIDNLLRELESNLEEEL